MNRTHKSQPVDKMHIVHRLITFTIFTFTILLPARAQHELGLHFMRNVWQSNITNPAIVQPQTLTLSVLGLRNNLIFDGPTYNQMTREENGKRVIDVDKMVAHLNPENTLRDDLEIPTVAVALRLGKLYLSIGHSLRYHAFFKYPKVLPQLVWQGNAQFIGQTVALDNELQFTGYHELAAGVAADVGPLTLGARAKLLSGIGNAQSDDDHHAASFFTDTDVYQVTLSGDYILNTSGAIRYNDFTDLSVDFNYGAFTFEKFFSANTGMAFDIGARLKLERLELAVSALDMGKITWDHNVTNYIADTTITYEGLDFSNALTGADSGDLNDALDTLKSLYKVKETHRSFSTTLPRRLYASALYHLTDRLRGGVLFFSERFRGETDTRIAVGGTFDLLSNLTVGASYALGHDRFDNLGVNVAATVGPVQVFAVSDNIFAAFRAGDSRDFGARIGGRIVLGSSE